MTGCKSAGRKATADGVARAQIRVIDILHLWDEDESGTVSKKEFYKALTALGSNAPKKDMLELFTQLDKDGSGEIDLNELNAAFRRTAELDASLRVGAKGTIETKSKSKSTKDHEEALARAKAEEEAAARAAAEAEAIRIAVEQALLDERSAKLASITEQEREAEAKLAEQEELLKQRRLRRRVAKRKQRRKEKRPQRVRRRKGSRPAKSRPVGREKEGLMLRVTRTRTVAVILLASVSVLRRACARCVCCGRLLRVTTRAGSSQLSRGERSPGPACLDSRVGA